MWWKITVSGEKLAEHIAENCGPDCCRGASPELQKSFLIERLSNHSIDENFIDESVRTALTALGITISIEQVS